MSGKGDFSSSKILTKILFHLRGNLVSHHINSLLDIGRIRGAENVVKVVEKNILNILIMSFIRALSILDEVNGVFPVPLRSLKVKKTWNFCLHAEANWILPFETTIVPLCEGEHQV
jgi:hypothetical protein